MSQELERLASSVCSPSTYTTPSQAPKGISVSILPLSGCRSNCQC